ncbi:MAG: hypothetical protein MK169_00845 [Candidatus Thalassarchaeum sp.]|nr:hypothetical protein [Candidatus Thalassarchaeum sp.]MCS5532157.1 hypothetical protein [Candidatus Poseidoniales archaeon]MEC8938859.1 hypothetical protein [Candidatus Thermoplasmatota archaeon]MEC9350974.1 hypothetical protein [Candidatus Thermoplasmatota archaeon]MEE3201306.1 hypothetical protein [Candidatus Thermoplasmatota archaeon]
MAIDYGLYWSLKPMIESEKARRGVMARTPATPYFAAGDSLSLLLSLGV